MDSEEISPGDRGSDLWYSVVSYLAGYFGRDERGQRISLFEDGDGIV